jgi:hypothetical protein
MAVGPGLANELGVADGVARKPADGLGVAVLEQATTSSSRNKMEPPRAKRPVRTLSSSSINKWLQLPAPKA